MVTAVLLGAGQRGYEIYGSAALDQPDQLRFVAVAEPDPVRRARFAEAHQIPADRVFTDWVALLALPKLADAAFICTQDRMHTQPTLQALQKGYHVLLEKPMSPVASECIAMGRYADKYDRVFNVCHVLRYSAFYTAIRDVVASGQLGEVVNIKHAENVGYWHQAHSFVRGNWRNAEESSPMILQKCCHDMDVILWLMNCSCVQVSSMGSLLHFRAENAPAGAPMRCTDGCPVSDDCPYNAQRFYLGDNTDWPVSVISADHSLAARRRVLETGPYGRCVYHCDNNVVDHQVVALEFEGGKTATHTMTAFTPDFSRSIEIMGTRGYLTGQMCKYDDPTRRNKIWITDFRANQVTCIEADDHGLVTGHEGADFRLAMDFVRQVQAHEHGGRTSAARSVESHLMSLAAEKSRLENRQVSMSEMWAMG